MRATRRRWAHSCRLAESWLASIDRFDPARALFRDVDGQCGLLSWWKQATRGLQRTGALLPRVDPEAAFKVG